MRPAMKVNEVMALLGVSRAQLSILTKTGELNYFRIGKRGIRFRPEYVEEYVKRTSSPDYADKDLGASASELEAASSLEGEAQ